MPSKVSVTAIDLHHSVSWVKNFPWTLLIEFDTCAACRMGCSGVFGLLDGGCPGCATHIPRLGLCRRPPPLCSCALRRDWLVGRPPVPPNPEALLQLVPRCGCLLLHDWPLTACCIYPAVCCGLHSKCCTGDHCQKGQRERSMRMCRGMWASQLSGFMCRYDGQTFVKPPEVLARDRLLGSYEVHNDPQVSSEMTHKSRLKCIHPICRHLSLSRSRAKLQQPVWPEEVLLWEEKVAQLGISRDMRTGNLLQDEARLSQLCWACRSSPSLRS